MAVRIRHIDYPVPTCRQLAVALGRTRDLWPKICLLVLSCALLAVVAGGWVGLIAAVPASFLTIVGGKRTGSIVRSWRAARRRRIALNGAISRQERQTALTDTAKQLVHDADQAWSAYVADAVVGRIQSVLHDRPAPNLHPLHQLEEIHRSAVTLNIDLQDDGQSPPDAHARLAVPPQSSFAPDTLSPTMMNLNAASLAQAKSEGVARAARRHQRMVDHAATFGPMLAFVEQVIEAARESPPH